MAWLYETSQTRLPLSIFTRDENKSVRPECVGGGEV